MHKSINLQDHITELVKEGRALAYQLETHFNARLVHKLRVCVRRLRTMLDLSEDSLKIPESSIDRLKLIWKLLGKVRDLDVGRELSDKYEISLPKLKTKRSHEKKKLRKELTDKKTQKLFDELEKLAMSSALSRVDPVPHLRKIRLRLIRTPGDAENLHELRIVLKKIRYFAEALEHDVEAFKVYQDVLGEFHDLEVFHKKHPHSLAVRKALEAKKKKALGLARPAVQLGLKVLGDIENEFEREMAIRAA